MKDITTKSDKMADEPPINSNSRKIDLMFQKIWDNAIGYFIYGIICLVVANRNATDPCLVDNKGDIFIFTLRVYATTSIVYLASVIIISICCYYDIPKNWIDEDTPKQACIFLSYCLIISLGIIYPILILSEVNQLVDCPETFIIGYVIASLILFELILDIAKTIIIMKKNRADISI